MRVCQICIKTQQKLLNFRASDRCHWLNSSWVELRFPEIGCLLYSLMTLDSVCLRELERHIEDSSTNAQEELVFVYKSETWEINLSCSLAVPKRDIPADR